MKISACLIAKNEEIYIERCIGSFASIIDEFILVDTGSTDNTVKVAETLGAKVYFYQWTDDFSAARNFALSKAKGDWIIFLDADEYFRIDDEKKLVKILNNIHDTKVEALSTTLVNYDEDNLIQQSTLPVIRVFRRKQGLCFTGVIHENLRSENGQINLYDARNEITIFHTGYSPSEFERKAKVKRNLDLLFLELNKDPENSDICFYISESYMAIDNKKALEFAQKVIKYNNSELGIYAKNYSNLIQCMFSESYTFGEVEEAIKIGVRQFPNYPDLYIYLGDLYKYLDRKFEAIDIFNESIKKIQQGIYSESRASLYIKEIYLKLGKLYYDIGNYTESVKLLTQLVKIDKQNFEGCTLLLNILLKFENENNIISFFENIYNHNDIKELIFLLKCSLSEKSSNLARLYFSLLPLQIKSDLLKEEALIYYYSKDFEKALSIFNKLNQKTNKFEIKKIICNFFINNKSITLQMDKNRILKELNIKILQGDFNQEDYLLEIINELIQLNEVELVILLEEFISVLGIDYKVGKLYQLNHRFVDALRHFDSYLEYDVDFDEKHLGNVLFNMSTCLFNQKEYGLAESFLLDSIKVYPFDFRVYDLLLGIYKLLNDKIKYDEVKEKLVSIVNSIRVDGNKKNNKIELFTLREINPINCNTEVMEGLKRLIIVGVNNISLRLLELIDNAKATIIAFITNNNDVCKKAINGVPVLNTDVLDTLEHDYLLIMDDSIIIETTKPSINVSNYFKYYYDFEIHRSFSNFLESDKSFEGLITGLSYLEVGIEKELLNYKTYNFANSSQDLYYDYEIAKWLCNYDEIKRNIKYVIIGIGYYSFEYDLSLSSHQNRVLMYYPFISKLHNFEGNRELLQEYVELKNLMSLLFKYDFRTRIFNAVKDLSEENWNKLISGKLTYEKIEHGRDLVIRDCNKNYPETVIENIKIITEYIEFLLENNITPILLVCPTTKYYHKNFSNRIKNEFKDIIDNLTKTYNIELLDYFDSTAFSEEDFYDVSHLNKKGAKKLTSILNQEISRILSKKDTN
ncbi:glycosyltransferase [Bacillus infantis]|uniref:Glycosyltransferase n=1 Tax=Bacillus infantis TaxID=324767 RepID=A0A5D4SN47_9BACI|nr:glycosyltransferase [Bacillus infantis]TYS63754.1 glycosyltransferase [Bacillus infantis]